ncbi:MAG: GntR family transcriptional regulator [Clostridiales bacterium]|nr:GntR family transcriptional regulator [Clostridiales bacterium]
MSGCEFVRDSLRLFVNRQKLSEGDRLPSEIALAKEFGVSRTVLRETYRLLERDGFIVVKGGAGTFLGGTSPPVKNTLNELNSTGTLIRKAGFEASAEIQNLEHRVADPEWAEKLRLGENERVIVVQRLRKADDTVIAVAWNIFIEELVGDTLENGILQDSIFLHLETECGIRIASAHTGVSALRHDCPRDRWAKEMLGDSALLLKRLHFDGKGSPVFYSLDYIRTDLVDLIVQQERNFY